MRHAKSSWGEPGLNDFDRPLIDKGRRRTQNIISYLLKKDSKPEFIICSPAVRAKDTALIMLTGLELNHESLREEKSIYTSDAEQLENLFFDLPDQIESLMLIGHNPAVTNFVNPYLENKIDALPTSAVVAIKFDTNEWDKIFDSAANVQFIIFPKMLEKN